MINHNFEDSIILGTYRSGRSISIPLGLDYEQKEDFLNSLDIPSAVDCLCAIEFAISSASN